MFVSLLLVLLTLAVFVRVIGCDFINFDDLGYIVENPHLQGRLNWENLVWTLKSGLGGNWHPVTWWSWMLDAQLFGMNPGGFHLTNLALHIANAVLLFGWLRRHTGSHWRSAVVAALFAWHPLHVESVAWIAERKDVLSTLFLLLTLWAYGRYAEGQRRIEAEERTVRSSRLLLFPFSPLPPFYWLALLFFTLGLMSKAMLVTMPFLLLLLDYWPLRRLELFPLRRQLPVLRKLLWEKLPFLGLSVIASVVTLLVQSASGAVAPGEHLPLSARAGNAVVAFARYLGKTFWPVDLAMPYPHPRQWPAGEVALAALLVAGLCVAALWLGRRRSYLMTGWFWFVGALIPVIGIVQVGMQSMADRYTYVPLIGFFIALTWGVSEVLSRCLSARAGKIAGGVLAALVLLACAARTMDQVTLWQDSGTLFRHAIAVTRNNDIAHHNVALYLASQGYTSAALDYYRVSLQMNPGNVAVMARTIAALDSLDRIEKVSGGRRSLSRPRAYYADARSDVGVILASQGKHTEAREQFRKALDLAPGHLGAQSNLGNVLALTGDFAGAAEHFRAVLQRQEHSIQTRFNLGLALTELGRNEEARAEFALVLRAQPGFAPAHSQLGITLAALGNLPQAEAHLREAVRLQPDSAGALQRLAWFLATQPDQRIRNGGEAVQLAARAASLTKNRDARALDALAAAYAETGRFSDAVSTAEIAVEQARTSGQNKLAEQIAARQKVYQAAQPYREAAAAPPQ